MARRVKQADGTYCYTEDCRIHDRSSDSTGLTAVINDIETARAKTFARDTSETLQYRLQIPEEAANRMAERVVDAALRKHSGSSAYDLASSISEAARKEGIEIDPTDNLNAAYEAHNAVIKTILIKPGDEVILDETGERGRIAEGNSAFGGSVRFNPESPRSRNSFAWFDSGAVTKVEANENSLARQQIFAAPRDALIPVSTFKQLLDEETNRDIPNAQGVKEVGRKGKAARENLQAFGDRVAEKYGDHGLTKSHILKLLSREYHAPMEKFETEATVKATKSSLRNILGYLDPTGEDHS